MSALEDKGYDTRMKFPLIASILGGGFISQTPPPPPLHAPMSPCRRKLDNAPLLVRVVARFWFIPPKSSFVSAVFVLSESS